MRVDPEVVVFGECRDGAGKMQHRIGATQQVIERFGVEEIALHHLDCRRQVRALRIAHQCAQPVATAQEFADGMSTGKAGGAGDCECVLSIGLVKSRTQIRAYCAACKNTGCMISAISPERYFCFAQTATACLTR